MTLLYTTYSTGAQGIALALFAIAALIVTIIYGIKKLKQ